MVGNEERWKESVDIIQWLTSNNQTNDSYKQMNRLELDYISTSFFNIFRDCFSIIFEIYFGKRPSLLAS